MRILNHSNLVCPIVNIEVRCELNHPFFDLMEVVQAHWTGTINDEDYVTTINRAHYEKLN